MKQPRLKFPAWLYLKVYKRRIWKEGWVDNEEGSRNLLTSREGTHVDKLGSVVAVDVIYKDAVGLNRDLTDSGHCDHRAQVVARRVYQLKRVVCTSCLLHRGKLVINPPPHRSIFFYPFFLVHTLCIFPRLKKRLLMISRRRNEVKLDRRLLWIIIVFFFLKSFC